MQDRRLPAGNSDDQPIGGKLATWRRQAGTLRSRKGWRVQHLAQARLRAIESGLPLMRAANTGVSAVIDARGGLRATLSLNREGRIDALLPGALPPTPYSRWGDWPVLALTLLVLGLAARSRRLTATDG